MQVHQDTFLRNVLDQQKLADIDVHVSALVALLGNIAPSDAGFRIKTTIEDMIYQSTLYTDKNVSETDFPHIRTAMDQHATRSTDQKLAVQSVWAIHGLLGCQGDFSQPYAFFLDTESMYDLFNTQYDSGAWSRKTIELKRQHICQFLEMTGHTYESSRESKFLDFSDFLQVITFTLLLPLLLSPPTFPHRLRSLSSPVFCHICHFWVIFGSFLIIFVIS
eukprot:COSAG01_NODE_14447_length_1452_cov_12.848485_2_plen_219_part_01